MDNLTMNYTINFTVMFYNSVTDKSIELLFKNAELIKNALGIS